MMVGIETERRSSMTKAKNGSKPKKSQVKKQVVVQLWNEIEVGWGFRPDGYSLHKDEEARRA